MVKKKDTLLLVDGHALMHRGFHAMGPLSTKAGEPTGAIYGFAMLLLRALRELAPTYVAVAFDLPEPTFRAQLYESYKAHRVRPPQELIAQIPRIMDLVHTFNIPIYSAPGYEADDLIGCLATIGVQKDLNVVILTGDMDALQLVDKHVKVYGPRKGLAETQVYDEAAVVAKYGLKPKQLVDFKALRGDPSDNIPGVKGIGEKTAIQLLQEFGTLEKLYKYLEGQDTAKIKSKVVELLKTYRADAFLSQKLGRIVCDLDIDLDLEQARLSAYDQEKVYQLFQTLEFRSLLDKLPKSSFVKPEAAEGHPGYKLVTTPAQLKEFLLKLKKQTTFALDTETTSQKPVEAQLLGIGFSWQPGIAYYVVESAVTPELVEFLAQPHLTIIGHNLKYDYLVLKRHGIRLTGKLFDTMIAAYLLNPGSRGLDLDTLCFNEFGFRKIPIESLIGKGKKQISMAEVEVGKVANYCCEDADFTWRLKTKLEGELAAKKLDKIFFEIEMPLIQVLADMEGWGVKIAPKVLKDLSREAEKESHRLQAHIYRLAGEEFNIGSPLQLKKILFDKLQIPNQELKKGKTGLSTAATELEKLRGLHPIIDLIFEWRELTKLKNTYLDALPELINPATSRVHTSFNQTVTATGRLSSSDPNLQNIPIRTALGRKIRRAFVAEKDFALVAIDYSQIELRLAAHLSGDEKMIQVFREGGDIHTVTAREMFGVKDAKDVTADMRRSAKTINFGVLYGLSAHGLSTRIPGISRGIAQDFIDKYFQTYPRLTTYLEKITAEARVTGLVKNEIGRVRYLPEIKSSNWQIRSAAERAAINMPFQSMNADIIKMAMNRIAETNLHNREDCRLLLQVHDELVFEIAADQVKAYTPQIMGIMQNIYKLKVPLVVEAKLGDNWQEMERVAV